MSPNYVQTGDSPGLSFSKKMHESFLKIWMLIISEYTKGCPKKMKVGFCKIPQEPRNRFLKPFFVTTPTQLNLK